ncbi:MAG: alpha/beta hydrolase [Pseudomonadota bacterium]
MPTSADTKLPVVILIHGAGLNGASWNPVRRAIDPRVRLLTPDLPGHGARIAEPFTLEAAAATVVDAVRSTNGAPVVVGGDSLGGYTSMAAAAALPSEQLKGMVLSGCSTNVIGARAMLPFLMKKFSSQVMALLLNQRQTEKALTKKLREFGISEPDIAAMMDAKMNPWVLPQAVDALRGVDFRAKVAAMPQPILLVNGGKDAVCMRQEQDFFAAAQTPQRYIFDDTDHGVSLLRSADFAAMVNRFATPLLGLAPA